MNDPFDDELRRSLHDQADRIPRRPDFSAGAISRARGIRRRRQVAGVVAATALVAIAVPIGLRLGDMVSNGQDPITPPTTGPTSVPTETLPSPATETVATQTAPTDTSPPSPSEDPPQPSGPVDVTLDLAELSEGAAPAIPYLDNGTVVGDGWSVDVPSGVTAVAPVTDGVYVTGEWEDNGWPLTRYAADGGSDDLGVVQGIPVASADGRWVTYVTSETDEFGNDVGPATLVLVDEESGESTSVELPGAVASELSVHTVVDGTVYFTYDRRNGEFAVLQTWTAGDASPERVPGSFHVSAVSADTRLVAHITSIDDFGASTAVIDRVTGEPLWETSDFHIYGFSPDGRYAWAGPAYVDGAGPLSAAILDARDGDVIREYTSPSNRIFVTFMDAVFEDGDSVLVRAEQDGGTAVVRCEVMSGECEAAAPLAAGSATDAGPPPPYLLPEIR